MRTYPNRTGIFRLGPVVVILTSPVAEGVVTLRHPGREMFMALSLAQGIDQSFLDFVTVQKAQLF